MANHTTNLEFDEEHQSPTDIPDPDHVIVDGVVLDALPKNVGRVILALRDKFQTPVGMCLQSVLSAVSMATQAITDVKLPHGTSPLSSFFLTLGRSGERKSAMDKDAIRGIRRYEEHLHDEYPDMVEHYTYDLEVYNDTLKQAKKDGTSPEAMRQLRQMLEKPTPPLKPNMLIGDATPAAIMEILDEAQPSLGMFLDEGGMLFGGSTAKGGQKVPLIINFSKVWDGSAFDCQRANKPWKRIIGRRLSAHILIQPELTSNAFADTTMRGQGYFGRFNVVHPQSTIGTRFYKPIPEDAEREIESFADRIFELQRVKSPVHHSQLNRLMLEAIPLSEKAHDQWTKFGNFVERNSAPDKKFASITDFASKAAEKAARIATSLTIFDDPEATEVGEGEMRAAIQLGHFYLEEALKLFGQLSPEEVMANRVYEWLTTGWKEEKISVRAIKNRGSSSHFRTGDVAEQSIEILERDGRLVRLEGTHMVNGSNARKVWRIVPPDVGS